MSLFDVINATLATKIADALGKYHKGFFTKRVLKTTEEVEANTNPKNLPSALVVGELINDLNGYSFGETDDGEPGYRKPGADTVTPFSKGVVEYIDSSIVVKSRTDDVASLAKSYAATKRGTLLIFCTITYTKGKSNRVTLNGAEIQPSYTETGNGTYDAFYNIPVKKGDKIEVALSATNIANYNIHTAYFMAKTK